MPIFTRFTEIISKKKPKRIVNITVKPVVTDCTGKFWFTDLMFQEGTQLSGYVINTETMLKNYVTNDEYAVTEKRFYNGIVRGSATCIILNNGKTSTGLDWKIIPNQNMKSNTKGWIFSVFCCWRQQASGDFGKQKIGTILCRVSGNEGW